MDLVLQQQNNSYKQIESLISTITQLHLAISRLERNNQDLQPDGYNAYMFIDIEHLCCLAHARAKFWYAYEQGSELALFLLEKIGALYGREAEYRKRKVTAAEIKQKRNDLYTYNIINEIKLKMLDLMATEARAVCLQQ